MFLPATALHARGIPTQAPDQLEDYGSFSGINHEVRPTLPQACRGPSLPFMLHSVYTVELQCNEQGGLQRSDQIIFFLMLMLAGVGLTLKLPLNTLITLQ